MNHPHRVWLGLGANLGDPLANVLAAVERLRGDAASATQVHHRAVIDPELFQLGDEKVGGCQ